MKAGMFVLLSTLFLCSCYAAAPKTYGEHLMRIEGIVPRKALESENKWIVKYGDFSGDGKEEMLAFVYEVIGGDGEMEWGRYYLYCSTQDGVAVCDTLDGDFYVSPEVMQIGDFPAIMFYTVGYGGPSGESFCWKCADNGLVPLSMPGEMQRIGENCLKCSKSGFDSFKADGEEETFSAGRCFYNYYYFFDGNQFREYGGKAISERQFSDEFGGAAILRLLKGEGLTVENIYHRANGIININCSYRTEKTLFPDEPPKSGTGFVYIEFEVTGAGLKTDEGLQPGRIKASLTPDCAVYPD